MSAYGSGPVPAGQPTADLPARISAFRARFARRQAVRVTGFPGGFAVRDDTCDRSHEHNRLVVDGAPEPAELPAIAERLLGHLPYRHISGYDDAVGTACAPPLAEAGYRHSTESVMLRTGPPPAAGRPVEAVPAAALRAATAEQVRRWMPAADAEEVRQLAARRDRRQRGADAVLHLAVMGEDGAPVSWADLYLVAAEGIAQVEELVTAEAHRGRGHAGAVLAEALRRAAAAGCGLCFLVADADDWPRQWYTRLGFTAVGRTHGFTRW